MTDDKTTAPGPTAYENVREGDKLRADEGFPCIAPNALLTVERSAKGLWVKCSEGEHYLDGQEDGNGNLVGLVLVGDRIARRSMIGIDGHVSDLFFNLDHEDTSLAEDGQFAGFDTAKLREKAEWLITTLSAISPVDFMAPTADDLVADFLARV